jgi:glycosyltransferase involved in cell wall biosynthesis
MFLLTSRSEGLSIALLEAMASGVLPAVPDVGDLRDVVVEGETGIFIDVRDPRGVAMRLDSILADAALAERLSRSARAAAVRHADIQRLADRWACVLGGDAGSTA